MNNYIDIYCERLAPGFWDEPLNAITNLSFLIAAFFAYKLAKQQGTTGWQEHVLIGLIALIGIGSFLFHTFATLWAQLMDVLPILFFQIMFLTFYARNVIGLCRFRTSYLLVFFFILIYGFAQFPEEWLNGSLGYAPALLFLTGFGIFHYLKPKQERGLLLLASAVFVVSLSFRSVDMAVCDAFPLGVHFLWHLFNGLVLYLTSRAYLVNIRKFS